MSTTCGSIALVGSTAPKNSAIAQRLIGAGLIIMGKTNMTVIPNLVVLKQFR